MDTKEAAWKQAGATHDVARQAAFDAKKAAIEAAMAQFDKEQATVPASLLIGADRLECLIDVLAFDVGLAREAYNTAVSAAGAVRRAAHQTVWEAAGEENAG